MESFPSRDLQSVAGWEYTCLSRKTAPFWQNQAFRGVRKMTMIYLVPDCKCVMVKFWEERNSLLSYDCKTGSAIKILDPSPVA